MVVSSLKDMIEVHLNPPKNPDKGNKKSQMPLLTSWCISFQFFLWCIGPWFLNWSFNRELGMSIPANSENKLRECCFQEIVQTHVLSQICSSLWRSYLSWPGNHLWFLLFHLLNLIKPCSSCGNRCHKVTFYLDYCSDS